MDDGTCTANNPIHNSFNDHCETDGVNMPAIPHLSGAYCSRSLDDAAGHILGASSPGVRRRPAAERVRPGALLSSGTTEDNRLNAANLNLCRLPGNVGTREGICVMVDA